MNYHYGEQLVESAMATNNSVTAFLNSGLSSLHNCSSLVLSKPATAVCSAPYSSYELGLAHKTSAQPLMHQSKTLPNPPPPDWVGILTGN